MEDISKELNDWNLDLVGVTETHLRDDVRVDGEMYEMIGKGRKRQTVRGGGVALLCRKGKGYRVEKLNVGNSALSEDVLAMKVECTNAQGKPEMLVVKGKGKVGSKLNADGRRNGMEKEGS